MKKTMYVVYDHNEMPFEKYNSLEDAYWWALGCWDDYWYPVFIDKFEWEEDIHWHCEDNDLWFEDSNWNWYGLDCEEDWGIRHYCIVKAHSKDELKLYDTICLTCNLSFKKDIDQEKFSLVR